MGYLERIKGEGGDYNWPDLIIDVIYVIYYIFRINWKFPLKNLYRRSLVYLVGLLLRRLHTKVVWRMWDAKCLEIQQHYGQKSQVRP